MQMSCHWMNMFSILKGILYRSLIPLFAQDFLNFTYYMSTVELDALQIVIYCNGIYFLLRTLGATCFNFIVWCECLAGSYPVLLYKTNIINHRGSSTDESEIRCGLSVCKGSKTSTKTSKRPKSQTAGHHHPPLTTVPCSLGA